MIPNCWSTFISPIASTRKSRKVLSHSVSSRTLGVNELLEVLMELEQLDDKLLRAAVIHGRKKLQALAATGPLVQRC